MDDAQFKEVIKRLDEINARLSVVEKQVNTLAKHEPMVAALSNSGVVGAVRAVNRAVSSLNPFTTPRAIDDQT